MRCAPLPRGERLTLVALLGRGAVQKTDRRWGVVRRVDAAQRTAVVRWMHNAQAKPAMVAPESPAWADDEAEESEVSVYGIRVQTPSLPSGLRPTHSHARKLVAAPYANGGSTRLSGAPL
jgi:hypothetical protein